MHLVSLGLGKTKLAGEAGAYARGLIGGGYGTAQGLAELDVENLVDAGMRKGARDAKLLMGRVSQSARRPVERALRKMAKALGVAWPMELGARGALPTRC